MRREGANMIASGQIRVEDRMFSSKWMHVPRISEVSSTMIMIRPSVLLLSDIHGFVNI